MGLARIPVLPYDDPDPLGPVEPVVAEGMFLSSEQRAHTSLEESKRRRATTRAYQIRARRRTTPQGVFATVSDLGIAETATDLAMGDVRARSYPNPVWLHRVLDRVLDSPGVLRELTFTANNLVARRGDRLEVQRSSDDLGTGPQRLSVRATDAVGVVMDTCRSGASWRQVAKALTREGMNFPDDAVDSVLRTLARHGFLLTDLTFSGDACTDPIGDVLDRFPSTAALHDALPRLRESLVEADAFPPGHAARLAALQSARTIADEVAPVWRPMGVDVTCDARILVSRSLAEQAAAAAGILWHIAPGNDRLVEWHERFLRRYSAQRFVPLLEVCDPVTGLGCDVAQPDPPPRAEKTAILAGLLHDALTAGSLEVRLGLSTIAALDRRVPGDQPPPSADLCARVVSTGALCPNEGFLLAISDVASPAGSTRARFAGLLTGPTAETDPGHGTMTAELAVRPLSLAAAVLTGRSGSAPWRIPIGTIPRPDDLLPSELALVSDGQHLSLWSLRHQRPVRPVHPNRLGHHLMTPLAGFLCLLGQHGTVPLSPWTWGPFDCAPFLPRVRWHETILAPARWRLPEKLRRTARDRSGWDNALHDWRTSAHPAPPNVIVVDDSDRHLPLDLDRREDRGLLRRYVARGVDAVTETPGGEDAVQAVVPGPAGNHCLEIVVPLSTDAESNPAITPLVPVQVRGAGHGLVHPGGAWLSLAIKAPPSTQDQVLERTVATVRRSARFWDKWFWLRYDTPERGPHLRVRFQGEPTVLGGRLLPAVRQFCERSMTEGLSGGFAVEPYDPEIERYGGHAAIETAETIFHRDSELVVAVLSSISDADERLALTAVSAAEITRIVAAGDSRALAPFNLQRTDRRVQALVRPRCRELDDIAPPHSSLWDKRAAALKTYRDLLPPPRRVDCASSLIHMHANRMLGDNHRERTARALAADLVARRAP